MLLVEACFCSVAQATAVSILPIIAAPAGSPVIPNLSVGGAAPNSCDVVPIGGYSVDSNGTSFTVIRYCDALATDVQAFVANGWGGVVQGTGTSNNCTSANSKFTHPADTCNGYWPWTATKTAQCPTGYVLSSGVCNPTGKPIPDKNLGPESCVGNPINAGMGMKFQAESDIDIPFGVGMKFERNYNSLQSQYISNKFENKHWRHNYERQLIIKDWQASPATVLIVRPNGKSFYFASVDILWAVDSDIPDRLTELKDGTGTRTGWTYTVAADDSVELYTAAGKLLSIADRAGRTQTLAYDLPATSGGDGDPETLDTVTDDTGRQLRFSYDASKRIATVTDPAGGVLSYGYDAQSNLVSVTYPDGRSKTYHYNEPANTAGSNLPHALTGITDENNNRYVSSPGWL